MRARFPLALVFAVVAAWTLVLASPAARAQTTSSGPSVNEIVGVVQRLEPNGVSADNPGENPHPSGVLVSDINFEDCDANLQYEFDLSISSLTSISGYNLDVWAGTADCSQLANRQAATAVCWPVKTPFAPNSNPQTVTVWMRDIVSQVFQASHTVTYSGTEAPASVCQLQTTTGPTNISLYFFFEQAANATGNEATYPVTVAMRAGDVQGDISIGIGQDLLVANIPPTTDTNVQGWNVYCDPPPGPVGSEGIELVPVDAPSNNGHCPAQVPDTGVVSSSVDSSGVDANDDSSVASSVDSAVPIVLDEAGGNACGVQLNDANIPSPGGCSASAVLVPGGGTTGTATVDEAGNEIFEEASTTATDEAGVSISGGTMKLPLPSQYLCGTGGVSSTQVNLLNLRDGVYYNVAVAAVDAYGNVGPLSNVACGEPRPVNDFWKLYYEAGGRAGGGFCSAEGVGTPAGTGGLGALMIASIVAMVRRRRRK